MQVPLFMLLAMGVFFLPHTRAQLTIQSPQVSSSSATQSGCRPFIDWNHEDGVWRMNCQTQTTCCVYEVQRLPDNSYLVWCDCSPDGLPPTCCHLTLRAFPDDPTRGAEREAVGSCDQECGDFPWDTECQLMWQVSQRKKNDPTPSHSFAACVEPQSE